MNTASENPISDRAAEILREQGWPVLAVTGTNEQDYADAVAALEIPSTQRALPWIYGSGFGETYELIYQSPKLNRTVWAYVLTHVDIDTYGQSIVVCERAIEDDRIGDLLEEERAASKAALRWAIDSGMFS